MGRQNGRSNGTQRGAKKGGRASMLRSIAALRAGCSPETGYLGPAVDLSQELVVAHGSVELLGWGIFNPNGPTMSTVRLCPIEGSSDLLLTCGHVHPFVPQYCAYGVLPKAIADDHGHLFDVLKQLFRNNGAAERVLFNGAPTHVRVPKDRVLSAEQIFELFWLAAQHWSAAAVESDCAMFEKHRGKPWARVTEEMGTEFDRLLAVKDQMQDKPEKEMYLALLQAIESEEGIQRDAGPPARSLFERWWLLATDPVHVVSELGSMEDAWDGSIKQFQMAQEGLRRIREKRQ